MHKKSCQHAKRIGNLIIFLRKSAFPNNLQATLNIAKVVVHYPPKLSYMIDSGSTPRESSIPTTAFDMGPGPHM